MKYVIAILKGILVGLAVLIPGVSGGSMIMTMGIYEQAISITSRDRKIRRSAIVFLIPYGIGIVVGILGLAFVIKWLMERYLFETALCFIGMILGSLPMLYKKVKGEKFSLIGAVLFLLMVGIMIALPHLSRSAGGEGRLTMSFTGALLAVILGFIGAGTMIVPGISGSMVMLVLGYYHDIIGHITGLKEVVKGGFSGAAIPWGHVCHPLGPRVRPRLLRRRRSAGVAAGEPVDQVAPVPLPRPHLLRHHGPDARFPLPHLHQVRP